MKVQPTPGPWEQSGNIIWSPDNGVICELSEIRKTGYIAHEGIGVTSPDWEEAMANGRMIAAAPEMLEALKGMREWARSFLMDDHPTVIEADRVIAKAEGE